MRSHHHPPRLLVVLALAAGTASGWVPLGGLARAADQPKGKGGEPPSVPQAAASSASSAGTTATSRTSGGSDDDVGGIMDHAPGQSGKWFDLGATWETHGLLWKTNTGNATRKLFNFGYLYGSVNITRNDRIRVRGGFYEYLLADPSESGVRGTDISVSYSHIFRLPANFNLRGTVAATIPVSFASQLACLYTAPTGSVSLSKFFDFGLGADLNVFGGGYWQKFSSGGGCQDNSPGGSPNAKGVFGGSMEIDYSFWFHKALQLGVDGYVAWLWYRDVGSDPQVTGNDYGYGPGKTPGSVQDSVYKGGQPTQQVYGFEVFLRYSFPTFARIHADLMVALANGDPTLGYVSRNIDGISYFFGNYYQNFEVYGAASLRY